jgi:hypothetical protein
VLAHFVELRSSRWTEIEIALENKKQLPYSRLQHYQLEISKQEEASYVRTQNVF